MLFPMHLLNMYLPLHDCMRVFLLGNIEKQCTIIIVLYLWTNFEFQSALHFRTEGVCCGHWLGYQVTSGGTSLISLLSSENSQVWSHLTVSNMHIHHRVISAFTRHTHDSHISFSTVWSMHQHMECQPTSVTYTILEWGGPESLTYDMLFVCK